MKIDILLLGSETNRSGACDRIKWRLNASSVFFLFVVFGYRWWCALRSVHIGSSIRFESRMKSILLEWRPHGLQRWTLEEDCFFIVWLSYGFGSAWCRGHRGRSDRCVFHHRCVLLNISCIPMRMRWVDCGLSVRLIAVTPTIPIG